MLWSGGKPNCFKPTKFNKTSMTSCSDDLQLRPQWESSAIMQSLTFSYRITFVVPEEIPASSGWTKISATVKRKEVEDWESHWHEINGWNLLLCHQQFARLTLIEVLSTRKMTGKRECVVCVYVCMKVGMGEWLHYHDYDCAVIHILFFWLIICIILHTMMIHFSFFVYLFFYYCLYHSLCAFYVPVDTVISCNGMNKVFCAATIKKSHCFQWWMTSFTDLITVKTSQFLFKIIM